MGSNPTLSASPSEAAAEAAGIDGRRRRWSLEFLDPTLERRFQEQGGREGLPGFRIACSLGLILWLLGGLLMVQTTGIDPALGLALGGGLAAMNGAGLLMLPWVTTLNRQHGIATPMAAANSLGVLVVTALGGILPGYAVGALLVVALFWFVARTRFIYALLRVVTMLVGFALVTGLAPATGATALDWFILIAGTTAILIALYLQELARRRIFVRDVVIAAQRRQLEEEKAKSERLLLNVLPAQVAERLREHPTALTDEAAEGTVLFADLVGFTPLAESLAAERTVALLNDLFSRFDDLTDAHGVEKVKTIGDAYMVVGGVPEPVPDHASRVVRLGLAMLAETAVFAGICGLPLELRVGIHSGPVVAGVIGKRKFSYDLWGDTVNSASRMESHGVAGAVQVSDVTWRLVDGEFDGQPRGEIQVKGRSPMRAWLVRQRGTGKLDAPEAANLSSPDS